MKLGKAFSDSLILEHSTKTRLPRETGPSWWLGHGRALLFASVLCVSLFILIWQLFNLSVIQGFSYRALADGNRTRELIRKAPRGLLLDRSGKPLVDNIIRYRLVGPCGQDRTKLCTTMLSKEEGEARERQGLPVGTALELDYVREYKIPEAIASVVGYTGELTEKELGDEYYALRNYTSGDRVGRVGAEAVFEEKLRGRDGRELVEVDAQGKILRTLGRDQELPGENVTLSLDTDLSRVAAEVFPAGEVGAIVVTRPDTGEVLALYSSPSFNPNIFSQSLSAQLYTTLINDADKPLFNRAIGGVYPPGSTFKIVTSLAALEEGAIKPDSIVEDTGVITIGSFSFPNWFFLQYGKTEGMVDILKAIQRSNDIFFYKAGEWLGIDKLVTWSRRVGLGVPLGIEIGGEAAGLVPDAAWKRQRFTSSEDMEARNYLWYLGDTYHMAIGQGYLLTTPLQLNAWTNVIANGGKLCRPTIKKVARFKLQGAQCKDLGIKKETIALITEGMKRACEPGGTGWPLFNFGVKSAESRVQSEQSVASDSSTLHSPLSTPDLLVPVACKTGTAEFGDPNNKTHAWFTVFAPLGSEASRSKPQLALQGETLQNQTLSGEPEISVTVLVEGAGEGSNVAAPVAKKIFEAWFSR